MLASPNPKRPALIRLGTLVEVLGHCNQKQVLSQKQNGSRTERSEPWNPETRRCIRNIYIYNHTYALMWACLKLGCPKIWWVDHHTHSSHKTKHSRSFQYTICPHFVGIRRYISMCISINPYVSCLNPIESPCPYYAWMTDACLHTAKSVGQVFSPSDTVSPWYAHLSLIFIAFYSHKRS